jgi:hypothetical protein
MQTLKSLMVRAILALLMFSGSGHLLASPVYHVSIDSRGLSGQGYLDFLFLGLGGAAPADVLLTNFSGDFDRSATTASNADGSLDAGVTIHNDTGWNEFGQLANFGGLFTFDVQFDVANDPGAGGSSLSIALLDPDLIRYVEGTAGDLVTFQVVPGQPATFTVSGNAAVVPEPATLAQMAAGFMLLGALRRRRRQDTIDTK